MVEFRVKPLSIASVTAGVAKQKTRYKKDGAVSHLFLNWNDRRIVYGNVYCIENYPASSLPISDEILFNNYFPPSSYMSSNKLTLLI